MLSVQPALVITEGSGYHTAMVAAILCRRRKAGDRAQAHGNARERPDGAAALGCL